jgi:hypothetical protein
MTAAFQIPLAAADPLQPGRDRVDMHRFAGVAGAGQGDLGIAAALSFGGAGFDEGEGLDRLDRGAWKNRRARVPGAVHHPAFGVDHDGAHTVAAFHPAAAGHLHRERVERRDLVQRRHLQL